VDDRGFIMGSYHTPPSAASDKSVCGFVNVECRSSLDDGSGWNSVTIHPFKGTTQPNESVVFLINGIADDALNGLYHQLSTSGFLAKSFVFITPKSTESDQITSSTIGPWVDQFAKTEGGASLLAGEQHVRFAFVVNLSPSSKSDSRSQNQRKQTKTLRPRITIAPSTHHGVLPNLDVIFVLVEAFQVAASGMSFEDMHMHPFADFVQSTGEYLVMKKELISKKLWNSYVKDFLGMACFGFFLATGRKNPHDALLNRNIPSLSILVDHDFDAKDHQALSNHLLYRIHHFTRALSNVHEQPHHSSVQYWMPAHSKFVNNNEYIIPCLLILLPLAVRAFTAVFAVLDEDKQADNTLSVLPPFLWMTLTISSLCFIVGASLFVTFSSMVSLYWWNEMHADAVYCVVYLCSLGALYLLSMDRSTTNVAVHPLKKYAYLSSMAQSLQCMSCFFAAYIHVPLMISHASLGLPSALFWVPILAWPDYRYPIFSSMKSSLKAWFSLLVRFLLLVTSFPPFLEQLVESLLSVDNDGRLLLYRPYFLMVFTPLHLICTFLTLRNVSLLINNKYAIKKAVVSVDDTNKAINSVIE